MNDEAKAAQYHQRIDAGDTLTLAEAVDYFSCTVRLLTQHALRPWSRLAAAIARFVARPFAVPGYQKIWAAYARDRFRQEVDGRRFTPTLHKAIGWMPDSMCIWLFKRMRKK